MSEKPTKAENTSTAASSSPRRSRKGDQRTLWLSRVSFALSAVALISVGYRSVARRLADDTQIPLAVASHSAAEPPRLAAPPAVHGDGATHSDPRQRDIGSRQAEPIANALVPRVQAKLQKGLAALRIKRLVVTQAVEGREPVDVDEVVDSETPVIAFVEVTSGAAEDQQVVVSFEHEAGHSAGGLNLSVPGNKPRWRTWGRTSNIKQDGRWTAVVRDSRGEELGRTEFTVRRQS